MSVRRMLPFIFVNIVISATVVLVILYWWDARQAQPEGIAIQQTAVATSIAPATIAAISESLPQPSATPEAVADEPLVHVVQAGDTLLSISQFYDVSMEDIMTVNDITNPNVLNVGQQLEIPVGGLPTATPRPAASATPELLPSPNPTEPPTQGTVDLIIADVVGDGELTEEAVQLVNSGSRQVGLLNWKLQDEDGHVYTFDRFTLFGDGSGVLVHTEAGQNSATDLYWGLEEAIWQSGEQVTLLDAEDTIQATFIIP